ncbi:MAG: hypothetical protein DRJ35_03715 [Thermoprotei archaeon]|nr:MAG: hypothetical protein DRJ35_03715 [Thermoprotei archaeon]
MGEEEVKAIDYIYLSFTSIKEKRGRALGAVLGVMIAVIALSLALGVGESFQKVFVEQLQRTLAANSIIVFPGTSGITDADIVYLKRIQGVKDVFGVAMAQGQVFTEKGTKSVTIIAVDPKWLPEYLGVADIKEALAAGEPEPKGLGVLLDSGLWKDPQTGKKMLDVGSVLPVTVGVKKTSMTFFVIGLLEETGGLQGGQGIERNYIYVHPDTFFSYISHTRRYLIAVVLVEDLDRLDQITDEIRSVAPPGSRIISPAAMVKQMQMFIVALQTFMALISAVGMGITAMWIFDSMTISVVQRTKEIGILKALGYSKTDILVLFLLEAAIISALGVASGTIIMFLISRFVYIPVFGLKLSPAFTPEIVMTATMLPFISDVLAAFIPSRRAANLNPVEALRYE